MKNLVHFVSRIAVFAILALAPAHVGAQTASTYYTAPTVAAVKALTTRPAVIEIVDANPGVFNWGTTPCSAADDIFQITPTSGPTGCYTRMATQYSAGKITATGGTTTAILAQRFSHILNVVDDYGADPTGVADSYAAFLAAYTALPATGGIIRVPSGTYKLSQTLSIQKSGTVIQCDGPTNTVLAPNFATTDVIKFGSNVTTVDYVSIEGCTITASVTRTAGAYINIDGAGRAIIQNVRMTGAFIGINIDNYGNQTELRIGNVIGETFASGGKGIVFGENSVSPNVVNGVYVYKTIFANVPTAFEFYYADGILMEAVQSYLATNAIKFAAPAAKTVSHVSVSQSFLDSSSSTGVVFLSTGGHSGDITFDSTAFATNGTTTSDVGLAISTGASVSGLQLSNNFFTLNSGAGILLASGTDVQINNNQFCYNSQATSGNQPGISVAAGIGKFQIIGNVIGGCGFQSAAQSNSQSYPVVIAVGGSDNYIIKDNRCQGNITSNDISDGGTGVAKNVLNACLSTVAPAGAAAGTLTGATLAAGVTASSLTSFGASPTITTPTIAQINSGSTITLNAGAGQEVLIKFAGSSFYSLTSSDFVALSSSYNLGRSGVPWGAIFATLPTSAGAGGIYVCVDTAGAFYKKASCP